VASKQFPGIYWTLNDSGNDPLIYAFDDQGRSRGTFKVDDAKNEDWESMALGPGRDGGFALYIGDTGDNDGVRRDSTIYRILEPQPEPPQSNNRPRPKSTASAEAFKFAFPGESRDTEAFVVHPETGQIVLFTKEFSGSSRVFRMPMPLDSKRTARLEQVGRIDTPTQRGLGAAVTDAAISPDGRRVAVRTYSNVLEFDLAESESPEVVVARTPSVYRLDDAPQGEGITYRADGGALMTIGESTPAVLYETPWGC
jgi:hypothetical protein